MRHLVIEGVKIPEPQSYKDCATLIQSDYYRCSGKILPWWRIYLKGFSEPSIKFLFWHRLTQYRGNLLIFLWAKWRHRHYMFKYGLMIPTSTSIGYGLYIGHPFGIIINHSAIIGNNVNLSQFTTIGANEGLAAVVEDEVYLGPSVSVVEHVRIGSGATVGAGAVVTHDLPSGCVAVGVPAKSISSSISPGTYINNKWILTKYL